MEQDVEKENKRLRDLLYSKIMFIEQLKKDYRNLVKDIEEITKNYNDARDLAIEFRTDNKHLNDLLDNALKEQEELREENEKLNKMTGIFSARLCEKYRTTLQEIKDLVIITIIIFRKIL